MIKTVGIKKDNILQGIDFSMKHGEMVAVMGPSGSGKSTLMYMLSGMDQVSEGSIIFQGKDITFSSEEDRAVMRLQDMGFVFQQMNMLPNLTILDNIILPAMELCKQRRGRWGGPKQAEAKTYQSTGGKKQAEKQAIRKAKELMQKVGIAGLEDRKISEVSGGQLQRAGICRALMNDPKILFADEPTGALNRSASEEVMKEFSGLNTEGMSILIVTHDSKVASYCGRVLYLLDGKIAGEYVAEKEMKREENEKRLNQWLGEHSW